MSIFGVTGTYDGAGVYYLGTGTSFDIKSMFPSDYNRFTKDNFIVSADAAINFWSQNPEYVAPVSGGTSNVSISYNKSDGVVSISANTATAWSNGYVYGNYPYRYGGQTTLCNFKVYLILGEIISI